MALLPLPSVGMVVVNEANTIVLTRTTYSKAQAAFRTKNPQERFRWNHSILDRRSQPTDRTEESFGLLESSMEADELDTKFGVSRICGASDRRPRIWNIAEAGRSADLPDRATRRVLNFKRCPSGI